MKTKKIVLLLIIMNLFVLSTWAVPQAHANVATKPLAITAKKVAKELAEESAVAMANEIVSQFLVRELVEDANVDDGYAAVCMDGAKDNLNDCPTDKRAQVKQSLTSGDRSTLANTVEQVLEQKTNTSSKWQKFLDFFIPIFLVSGLVATFDSMLDGDSESLIDEIAQESLISSGLLKPLSLAIEEKQIYDFTPYISSVDVSRGYSDWAYETTVINAVLKPNTTLKYSFIDRTATMRSFSATESLNLGLRFNKSAGHAGSGKYFPILKTALISVGTNNYGLSPKEVYRGSDFVSTSGAAEGQAGNYWAANIHSPVANGGSINGIMNAFLSRVSLGTTMNFEVSTIIETPPEIETDYGTQTGLDKTKNPDGTKTLPGVDSFTYTYNNTNVYPATDSTTGWKDKTTGEDITVIEDDVIVDGGPSTNPDTPPKEDEKDDELEFACKEKMELPDFKPVSNAFTHAFPFSIPWDIKRAIDAAFGGVGDSKPSFPLPMFGDGVVLTVPDMIDNWMPFLRGFLVLMFDVSILFLFYRFMKGGGD